MKSALRLDAADRLAKEWHSRCAVCGTQLIAVWMDFDLIGRPLCDRHMRQWQRGKLDLSQPTQAALPGIEVK